MSPAQLKARCNDSSHRPVTYDAARDRTWCLCGRVSVDGYQVATTEEDA